MNSTELVEEVSINQPYLVESKIGLRAENHFQELLKKKKKKLKVEIKVQYVTWLELKLRVLIACPRHPARTLLYFQLMVREIRANLINNKIMNLLAKHFLA